MPCSLSKQHDTDRGDVCRRHKGPYRSRLPLPYPTGLHYPQVSTNQTSICLTEGVPGIEMRVFLRDKNPDLMDQYLNQGIYRSIPVFAFFDEQVNAVACFIERPPKVTEHIEAKMLAVRRALRAEQALEWRQTVVDEVRGPLKA